MLTFSRMDEASMRVIRWMNLLLAASLLLLFGSAGCSSGSNSVPAITSFTASPSTVNPGVSTQLVWAVKGSTALSIDNGVGSVSGTSASVSPAVTTTYTLTASNGAGLVTAKATVTVNVEVVLGPSSIVLLPGATKQFNATVMGSANTGVTWAAVDSNGGSITTGGMYTAPTAAGVYHVQAVSQADATVHGTALVTVDQVGVSFAPDVATVITKGSQNVMATVTGATLNSGVTWSVDESGGGSVLAGNGNVATYTAPASSGLYHVRATSVEDPSKYAEIPITVNQVAVAVVPATISLVASSTYQFSANVTGSSNTAVTWSVVEAAGGSIGTTGLYQVPASGGPYHVQATSQADPTVSSLAAVTVDAVGVSVLPSAVTLDQGATQQFSATVTGATGNPGVLWSVTGTGGGSVDSNGLYTAGSSAGTDYVNVASQENPGTTAATATVTVNPPPTFTLGLSPTSLSIPQNGSSTTQVTATPLYGLPGTVGISITNPGSTTITGAYDSDTGILTVSVPAAQPTGGPYALQVLGTYGTIEIPQSLPVYVTAIAAPTVTGLAPNQGPTAGGTTVTLAGTNFTTDAEVHFGTTPAPVVAVPSSSQLTVTAPAQAAGVVDVTVGNRSGTSTLGGSDRFSYLAGPSVTGVTPNYGSPSSFTSVVVSGSQFTGATSVLFGEVSAMNFTVVSDTVIHATSPGGPDGVVDVTVTGPGGTSSVSAADQFAYLGPPVVFGISPDSGQAGDVITLTGVSFSHAYAVTFGDIAALSTNITVVSDTEITVTVPVTDQSGGTGTVAVTVTTPMGMSSAQDFTYD
jgi:hypothetical protein